MNSLILNLLVFAFALRFTIVIMYAKDKKWSLSNMIITMGLLLQAPTYILGRTDLFTILQISGAILVIIATMIDMKKNEKN